MGITLTVGKPPGTPGLSVGWLVAGVFTLFALSAAQLLAQFIRRSWGLPQTGMLGVPKLGSRLARYFLVLIVCLMVASRIAGFALQRHASPTLILGVLTLPVAAVGIYIVVSEVGVRRGGAGMTTGHAQTRLPKLSYRLAFYLFLVLGSVGLVSNLEQYARERQSLNWVLYFFLADLAILAAVIARYEVKMGRKTKRNAHDVDAH